jgi:hypothetical protein
MHQDTDYFTVAEILTTDHFRPLCPSSWYVSTLSLNLLRCPPPSLHPYSYDRIFLRDPPEPSLSLLPFCATNIFLLGTPDHTNPQGSALVNSTTTHNPKPRLWHLIAQSLSHKNTLENAQFHIHRFSTHSTLRIYGCVSLPVMHRASSSAQAMTLDVSRDHLLSP